MTASQIPGEGKEVSLVPAYTQQNDITKQRKKEESNSMQYSPGKKGLREVELASGKKDL
jgi:hypothetical protein